MKDIHRTAGHSSSSLNYSLHVIWWFILHKC